MKNQEMPQSGGRFVRDPKTGALKRVDSAPLPANRPHSPLPLRERGGGEGENVKITDLPPIEQTVEKKGN